MGKKIIILLASINLLLSSCNKLFYETPMPIGSEIDANIPNSFLGDYLQVNYEENTVEGYFKTISKISEGKYLIESKKVIFLDSLDLIAKKMSSIRKVNVKNDYLEIITKKNIYKKKFSDTLSSEPKREEYELNFKENTFYDSFNSKKEHEESKRRCQLRKMNDKYYLNIEYFKKYWMITEWKGFDYKYEYFFIARQKRN